jgi:hypothetical protein
MDVDGMGRTVGGNEHSSDLREQNVREKIVEDKEGILNQITFSL